MPLKKQSKRIPSKKSRTRVTKTINSPLSKYILNNLYEANAFSDLLEFPREFFENKKCNTKGVKILITNTPCNGFGDLIFAWKLAKLLKYYYKADVKIASTLASSLLILGVPSQDIYSLVSKTNPFSKKRMQCRKYGSLQVCEINSDIPVDTDQFDLFFDAPLMADFEPDPVGLRKMIPKSNPFNTFFFSEYNDELDKGFDFNTGIGETRDGLLFLPPILNKTAPKSRINSLAKIKKYGQFALAYIADIEDWQPCIEDFVEMISFKYKYPKMQLICPSFTAKDFLEKDIAKEVLGKNYDKLVVFYMEKGSANNTVIEKNIILNEKGTRTFYIRGDVFPVNNNEMLGLIKYSVKDILLTGDQSITDALSCCERKNIFYQIAPWKENLGHYLAKLMPQKYLLSNETECGTLKALRYNANYHNFVNKWNFMKRAGPRLNGIICTSALSKASSKDGEFLRYYMEYVLKSRSISSVESKMKKFINT